ncbi:thioredoxin family protein [Variovorax arabinosiphilus]|uniref:thioredoxin family protein n=1 Tax=Variovorax arabinosiphilus TaxID=3053498 RepID=UPI0025769A3B|nr:MULTISPECIES: thioredoxin family protein [unclassified Variovorax]MDM0122232.1 thioredoxin family protein [Variovorax sp. J2L1-78]MDM0131239.1 thioredoxin family protein [Variovorax sp. J2L1-63]MDM0234995.1 thioredoxin family protein [Variovorax sp. J2R1-6]
MPSLSSSASRSARAARDAGAALSRASRRAVMAAAVALGSTLLIGAPAHAAPAVGQKAPDFVAMDTRGKQHQLSDFAGKYVVLEWTNPGCPFVRKHYGSGNMPATQKAATAKGVVWLAINSTERAASDYLQPAALDSWMKTQSAAPTAVLMDEDGTIGQAYGARTTPHIFIIDPKGTLVYAGGIDSIPSARPDDIKTATNYVNQALGEAFGGRPVSAAATRPYGCSIKYKS